LILFSNARAGRGTAWATKSAHRRAVTPTRAGRRPKCQGAAAPPRRCDLISLILFKLYQALGPETRPSQTPTFTYLRRRKPRRPPGLTRPPEAAGSLVSRSVGGWPRGPVAGGIARRWSR